MIPCSHDNVTVFRTLGKLTAKCGGCRCRKKWPWILMTKCRQCKKIWHPECFKRVKSVDLRPVAAERTTAADCYDPPSVLDADGSIQKSAEDSIGPLSSPVVIEPICCAAGRLHADATLRTGEEPRERDDADSRHGQTRLGNVEVSPSTALTKKKKRVTFKDVPDEEEPIVENKQNNQRLENVVDKDTLIHTIESLQKEIGERKSNINIIKEKMKELDVLYAVQKMELGKEIDREGIIMMDLIETVNRHKSRLKDIEQSHAKKEETKSLYDYLISNPGTAEGLRAVEVEYDVKDPEFGICGEKDRDGVYIEWATERMGLSKGDRLVEINGVVVLTTVNVNELNRMLQTSPSTVRMVVDDRAATEPKMEFRA